LTGYLYANGATAVTASTTIPTTVLSGTLQAAQFPALTGDVTTTAGSLATSLVATSNATLTTLSSLSSIGTITTGTWHGTALGIAYGGTGVNAANTTQNYVFAAPSTGGAGAPTFRALVAGDLPGGTGTVTTVGMTVPAFLIVSPATITTSGTFSVTYSGTALPVANGGTSVTSVTTTPTASSFAGWDANKNLSANSTIDGYATTVTSAGTLSLTVGSAQQQYFTGSTAAQVVALPLTTTLVLGQQFQITNLSSVSITVNTNGAALVKTMIAGSNAVFTVTNVSVDAAASWQILYVPLTLGTTLPVSLGGTGLTVGTSGGIPYFSSTTAMTSSALLTAHGILLGGGSGASPTALAVGGSGTLLTGVAASAPAFSATPTLGVNATTAGTLGLANGGTSGTTITLQNLGNITTGYNFNLPITAGTTGQLLTSGGGSSTSMTWTSVTGTGNAVLSAGPTLTGTIGAASMTLSGTLVATGAITPNGGIVGTTAGGNATAGNVGEYVSANSAGVTWGTSTSIVNIASISLTAGDWDVYGTALFSTGGTSVATQAAAAISLTTGAFDSATLGGIWSEIQAFATSASYYAPISLRRINVSTTTTVYLTGQVTYSTLGGGTWGAGSIIQARRVR
jgi:hypothetical protein